MSIWFVSRHPGAVEWAERTGLKVDRRVLHLSAAEVAAGDTIIGVLPVNMAAEICARNAAYVNLSLDLPFEWRGKELSCQELFAANARLEGYVVTRSKHQG